MEPGSKHKLCHSHLRKAEDHETGGLMLTDRNVPCLQYASRGLQLSTNPPREHRFQLPASQLCGVQNHTVQQFNTARASARSFAGSVSHIYRSCDCHRGSHYPLYTSGWERLWLAEAENRHTLYCEAPAGNATLRAVCGWSL